MKQITHTKAGVGPKPARCQFAEDRGTDIQCTEPATRPFGGFWFCDTHGSRTIIKSTPTTYAKS